MTTPLQVLALAAGVLLVRRLVVEADASTPGLDRARGVLRAAHGLTGRSNTQVHWINQ